MITTIRHAAPVALRRAADRPAPSAPAPLGTDTRVKSLRPAPASAAEATRQAEAMLATTYHPDAATFARNLAALQLAMAA